MRKTSTLALIVLLSYSAQAQLAPQADASLFRHMAEVNAQWQEMDPALASNPDPVHFANEADRIAQHLHLVSAYLRSHVPASVAPSAKANRTALLNDLDAYADRGTFPQNHVLPYRNPVFIDPMGTACAVGQLMIESGHRELAESISRDMNLAYVHDMKRADVLQWATAEGFTEDELAWIQPGYPPMVSWSALGGGTNGPVQVLLNLPDGTVLVAGAFTEAGGVPVQNVALFQGPGFGALGAGVQGTITCGAVLGTDIYLGGYNLDGINDLAHWDGTQWTYTTVFSGKFPQVFALHVLNDTLYAAGETQGFAGADEYVMQLQGSDWQPLPGNFDAPVRCLDTHDGRLVAGGEFTSVQIGGPVLPAGHVAIQGPGGWTQLGDGLNGAVLALLHTEGTLYAGGAMYGNASPVFGLARIGPGASVWEPLMPNLGDYVPIVAGTTQQVHALLADGDQIYVGGDFDLVQLTVTGKHLARFTGTPDGFEPIAYFNGPVNALASGALIVDAFSLYAGGAFTQNIGDSIPYLAETILGTGIRETPESNAMALYPNPASDRLTVTLERAARAPARLEVMDVQGRTVITQPLTGRTATLDVTSLAAGAYTLHMIAEGERSSQPFIKP